MSYIAIMTVLKAELICRVCLVFCFNEDAIRMKLNDLFTGLSQRVAFQFADCSYKLSEVLQ